MGFIDLDTQPGLDDLATTSKPNFPAARMGQRLEETIPGWVGTREFFKVCQIGPRCSANPDPAKKDLTNRILFHTHPSNPAGSLTIIGKVSYKTGYPVRTRK
jgi:hypothetical protein